VDHLPLEVRALDHVVVDDPDRADARGREVLDDRRAESASTDHECASVEEALWPSGPTSSMITCLEYRSSWSASSERLMGDCGR